MHWKLSVCNSRLSRCLVNPHQSLLRMKLFLPLRVGPCLTFACDAKVSSLLLELKCVCMTFGVPVYSGHECLEQLPSITATYIVRQPDRPRFAVGRVIELAATYMLQTHRCTGLHPSVQCSLQQHPHQLHLLQQFLPWQLLSEGLPSLRLAVRSAQGSLRMCPLVTKLPGGSSMHQSYACRTDHCKKPA